MPQSLDQQIQFHIQTFVDELALLVKRAAIQSVSEALSDGAPIRRGPGRPRGSGARAASPRAASRRKGGKRDPGDLAALTDKLYAQIKGNAGQRIEQIAGAMGVGTKELALPAKKLIAAKKVRTTGTRRATKYFPK